MYTQRIQFLEESLRMLGSQIAKSSAPDLPELLAQQSNILAELSQYRRLQWEEDHERVNFDDDHDY